MHRPVMDPDHPEYSNDDPTWGLRRREECAFCWHPSGDHDAQGCTVDLREADETVVVCGCLGFEEEAAYVNAS